jgi:hypothetical protein
MGEGSMRDLERTLVDLCGAPIRDEPREPWCGPRFNISTDPEV